MVARTETPNASLPWLVRITANCPNLLDAPTWTPFHAALGEGSAAFSPVSQPILAETEWSFTLPTRRAPIQPARPTACSLQANTLHATLEMAASLCSPMHRGPHGSLLLAESYTPKNMEHPLPRQGFWGDV
jgi:hypothetical protein